MNNQKGTLYLIPAPLGEGQLNVIPDYLKETVFSLKHFIVEREKTARHYLKDLGYPHPISDLVLFPLNEHTPVEEWQQFLEPLKQGFNMGILSEAGCPGVADPGAVIVAMAHQQNITVVPFVGPSSILLALMASGMNGQGFTFHGYLPVKEQERRATLIQLDAQSAKGGYTQIFIEAPYRNNQLLRDIVSVCKPETKLCIAVDLTMPSEKLKTKPIKNWKGTLPGINKKPAVFLLQA